MSANNRQNPSALAGGSGITMVTGADYPCSGGGGGVLIKIEQLGLILFLITINADLLS